MATQTLVPSTCQVAGLTTTQVSGLTAVQMGSASLTIADLASLDNSIVDDQLIINNALGPSAATIQAAVMFTATTVKNTASMTSFVLVSPSTATISSIVPGMRILGKGMPSNARVLSATGTTLTLNINAVSSQTTQVYAAVPPSFQGNLTNGQLMIPNRGTLKVFPGDVIAVDNLGWPILISSASINFNAGGVNSGAPWILKA